jgi:hypothetical protein
MVKYNTRSAVEIGDNTLDIELADWQPPQSTRAGYQEAAHPIGLLDFDEASLRTDG